MGSFFSPLREAIKFGKRVRRLVAVVYYSVLYVDC